MTPFLNAGVPEELIFYSGDRSSGIPTGTDIRARLLEELRAPDLVVELLSLSFLAPTWCLLEVGAARGLGKSTYPIVVPPLALESAVAAIGQVQVGRPDTQEHVEAVFDELHERLKTQLAVDVRVTSLRRGLATSGTASVVRSPIRRRRAEFLARPTRSTRSPNGLQYRPSRALHR